jgi:hypothetical protein
MKSLQVAMFPQESETSIGKSIVLISNEGKDLEIEQFLRITEVSTRTAYMIIDGKQVEYKIATYGLSDALKADFVGLSAKQWYEGKRAQPSSVTPLWRIRVSTTPVPISKKLHKSVTILWLQRMCIRSWFHQRRLKPLW